MAELPRGTVTFLFTDIEGSTRLLDQLGAEEYGSALAEHRRVLRDAFGRHGGVEVDTQGDAFFVAFPTAPGALAAADEAQRELELPVRMGLHTGTPLLTEEGYVGADVHRAARIAAAGHGGQILVSTATVALVERDTLRDLGEHRLKDLSAPERIFQVGVGDFGPLKTLYRTNLPVPAWPLVGRDAELEELIDLVRAHRLVTVTGPGGTGKTRLAVQAAAELADAFPDGLLWIPLAGLADSELVPSALAAGAGVRSLDELGGRRALLVLDNFEHLLAAAGVVADILASGHEVQAIATSRSPLHIAGEHDYPLDVLGDTAAVTFFVERAAAAGRAVEADDVVRRICGRLDNLPLALELAAARAKLLDPASLLSRLDDRLALLTGGMRDAPARQQTLRATIDWSHDLLGERGQETLRRLSVFAGGFDLDAAEEVGGATLEDAASLVDLSLVKAGGNGRFLLLDTIREYAALRLTDAGEAELYRGRLLERVLQLLRSLDLADPDSLRFDRISEEEDNVRAALDYALQSGRTDEQLELVSLLGYFWLNRGRLEEGLRWSERIDEATREAPLTKEKVFVTSCIGECLRFLGRPSEAIPWKERALERARQLGFDQSAAATLHDLADIYVQLGDLQRARELSLEALVIREREGDPNGIAHALSTLPDVAVLEGDLDEALALCDRITSLVSDGDIDIRRVAESTRAEVYRRRGDERRAAECVVAAAKAALVTGGSYSVADLLLIAADLLSVRAPKAAAQLVASARRVCRETGYTVWPVLESERIAGAVEATQDDELGVDEALRLVLDCLD